MAAERSRPNMLNGNLKTALASLRMSKWRTIFTMLGIIIGVSSVITIVSLGEGLKHQIVGQIKDIGSDVVTVRPGKLISKKNGHQDLNLLGLLSTSSLSAGDVKNIQKLSSVKSVVPIDFVTNNAVSDEGQMDNAFVAGTSSHFNELLHQKMAYGDFFSEDEEDQNVAIIGPEVASQLFNEFNPVGHSIKINGQNFIIHGVFEPSPGGGLSIVQGDFNSVIFIPFGPAQDLVGGHTNILQILARSQNPDKVNQTVSDVTHTLRRARDGQQDFTVLRQSELLSVAGGVVNTATGFITAIAAVSLLVGGIGIMDIMLVSVSERTREIGIRKAVGATNRQILNQFLIEGLALTIGGGIIGILIALIINLLLKIYTSWEPIITWPTVILAVGVSMAIGIIFSAAPAFKAARKDPINALRGE